MASPRPPGTAPSPRQAGIWLVIGLLLVLSLLAVVQALQARGLPQPAPPANQVDDAARAGGR